MMFTENVPQGNRDKEFSYLNSGLFIGTVKALRKCIIYYEYNDTGSFGCGGGSIAKIIRYTYKFMTILNLKS